MVGWYSNLGLEWRVLLPFMLIATLVAVGAGAVLFNRTASGDTPKRLDVATIVFVEADVPPPTSEAREKNQDGGCSIAKRDMIWKEAENLLSAYWKRAVGSPGGAKWSLWMYALNGAPGAGKELVRIGPRELADVNSAKGLTRTQREKDGWRKYADAAKTEYRNSFEQHPRQSPKEYQFPLEKQFLL